MIAPPSRPAGTTRATGASDATPPSSSDVDAGEIDAPATQAALAQRIAALAARPPTPDEAALEQQREAFDAVVRAQTEIDREINALRDMAMEQMKNDDELLKKWIELI